MWLSDTETRRLWESAWRQGLAPLLRDGELESLEHALETDDPRLVQGKTTVLDADGQVCRTCLLAFIGTLRGIRDVDELHRFFHCTMGRITYRKGVCHYGDAELLTSWFDRTPRAQMREQLLQAVREELARRDQESATVDA